MDKPTKFMIQTATAVAHAREGRGIIRVNGSPINLVQPEILRLKVYEPVLVAGEDSFSVLDIRVRVKGGGHTSQVYAIRQAIAKALIAYYAKYVDAYSAMELKKKLVAYDRTLLIADPRRMEPKKFGGHGARARRQKRCVISSLIRKTSSDHAPPYPVTVELYFFYSMQCILSCSLLHSPMHAMQFYEHGHANCSFKVRARWLSPVTPATLTPWYNEEG